MDNLLLLVLIIIKKSSFSIGKGVASYLSEKKKVRELLAV